MFMRDWGTKQQGKMDNCGHFMGVPQCTIRKVRSLEIVAYCGPLSTLLRMSHRYNKKDNKGSGSFQFEDLTVIVSTAVYEIHGILPTGHALDSSPPISSDSQFRRIRGFKKSQEHEDMSRIVKSHLKLHFLVEGHLEVACYVMIPS